METLKTMDELASESMKLIAKEFTEVSKQMVEDVTDHLCNCVRINTLKAGEKKVNARMFVVPEGLTGLKERKTFMDVCAAQVYSMNELPLCAGILWEASITKIDTKTGEKSPTSEAGIIFIQSAIRKDHLLMVADIKRDEKGRNIIPPISFETIEDDGKGGSVTMSQFFETYAKLLAGVVTPQQIMEESGAKCEEVEIKG